MRTQLVADPNHLRMGLTARFEVKRTMKQMEEMTKSLEKLKLVGRTREREGGNAG